MQPEQQLSGVLGEPQLCRHSQFALNEQGVTAWLHKLPRANLGQSTRHLLDALTELNDVSCVPRARLACLEVLRPEICVALKAMARHYGNGALLVSRRAHQVAGLCDLLNRLLAEGYARVLCDLNGGLSLRSRGRERALACHRALVEHGRILLRNYQLHQAEPEGYWHFLHSLYRVALARDLTGAVIDDPEMAGSVRTAYLRSILLAAASPYQLSRRDLLFVNGALPQWADYLALRGGDPDKWAGSSIDSPPGGCALVFDPAGDSPPRYYSLETSLEGRVGIDTQGLIALLNAPSDNQVHPSLRNHLSRVWSSAATRRQARSEPGGKLDVAIGVGAAHYFASGGDDGEFDKLQNGTCGDTRYRVRMVDADGLEYATSDSGEVREAVDFNARYKVNVADIMDRSERGYSVRLEGGHCRNVSATDLLALREPCRRQWHLGMVRWVRETTDGGCTAGVEVLGQAVVPCQVETADSDQSSRGFILLRDRVAGLPQRILLPGKLFGPGRKVALHSGDDCLDTALGPVLDSAGLYDIYSLEDVVEEAENDESESVELETMAVHEAVGAEFDLVWSQL